MLFIVNGKIVKYKSIPFKHLTVSKLQNGVTQVQSELHLLQGELIPAPFLSPTALTTHLESK